mmetsp:Transcript_40254/g.82389  ORF Transcript_40254/g.82389 Transcript_40254/m.82389 type:complete len:404 (-) Transcript_40254:2157-3368(-)
MTSDLIENFTKKGPRGFSQFKSSIGLKKKKRELIYEKLQKTGKELHRPFIGSFFGHQESILHVKSHSKRSSLVFTGAADGEIRFWLINQKKCLKILKAHEKFIRGLEVDSKRNFLITCSDDCSLKLWNISEFEQSPKISYKGGEIFNSLSLHPTKSFFVTGGKQVLIWDQHIFKPIQKLFWGASSISCMKFNPIEYNIVISSGSDRSIVLYDLRLHTPIKKFILDMRSNDISWNENISSEFTLANEDSNLYTFDIRNLNQVKKVYQGHVLPVLSLDQDRNNQTILSGSCDSTIRIFSKSFPGNSEIFHTQRMRKVLTVGFSIDQKYILSGSEDGNLRLWANLSSGRKNTILKGMEQKKFKKLIENRAYIFNHISHEFQFLPKMIRNLWKTKKEILENEKKKKN